MKTVYPPQQSLRGGGGWGINSLPVNQLSNVIWLQAYFSHIVTYSFIRHLAKQLLTESVIIKRKNKILRIGFFFRFTEVYNIKKGASYFSSFMLI